MEASASSEARESTPRGGRLAAGLVLIFLGLWFGMDRLGVALPGLGELWPAFPFLAGVAFLVAFGVGGFEDPGLVFPGTAAVLVGLFFGLFSVGPLAWDEMARLWPCFPLIAGIAFLVTWVAGRGRQSGLLIPAALGLVVGVVGLFLTYELFTEWLVPVVDYGWPVALIAFGVFLVWRSLRRAVAAD